MNMPLHVLGWFWALLPTLGESGPGWLLGHAMQCLLGDPPLPLLGVAAHPHLPFPSSVLMTPMMRRERISDALPVTEKHLFFSSVGKTAAIV